MQNCKISLASKAFSLIQLMIALGLSVGVLGGAFLLIRSFTGNFNTSEEMVGLQREMEDIQQIIDTDLELAVRITGSARNEPGIFQLPTLSDGNVYVRDAAARDEVQGIMPLPKAALDAGRQGLVVLKQVPGIDGVHVELRGGSGWFTMLGEESSLNTILPSLNDPSFPLFLASSGSKSELIQVVGVTTGQRSDLVGLDELVQSFGLRMPQPAALLELIVYERYDDQASGENRLVRRRYLKVTPAGVALLSSEKIIAKNMVSFEPKFGFHESRSDGSLLTPPTAPIAHLSEDSCTGSFCVSSTDISKVTINLSLKSDDVVSADAINSSDFYEVDSNGHLIFVSDRVSLPTSFNTNLGVAGGAAVSTCNVSNMFARCNPECSSIFRNETAWADPNHPWNGRPLDWEGYGDLNSDYCKCARVPGSSPAEYQPPEQHQGKPGGIQLSWANAGHRSQITACAEAMSACNANSSTTWLQEIHPGAKLACHCLQPRIETSPFYDLDDSDGDGRLQLTLPASSEIEAIIDGTSAQNNLFCYQFQLCDGSYQQYYGRPTSETPWIDSCRCRTRNVNLDRSGTAGTTHGLARDWAALCGLGGTPGNYDCAGPEGPLDNNGNYISGSQSLTETEKAHCECLKASGYDPSNYNRFGRSTINGMSANTINPLNNNRLFDFGDPSSASFSVNRADGNGTATHFVESRQVNVDGNDYVCAENYCNQAALAHPGGINSGCRIARFRNVSDGEWQQIIDQITVPPALSSMDPDEAKQRIAGFCTRAARTDNWAVERPTRELLTNTASGGTLPSWCTGPSANTGF